MSKNTLCCLCRANNILYQTLIDDSGQESEVYEITVKYFDPKILQTKEDYNASVVCLECWQHITDFHTFQQTILTAQTTLKSNKETIIFDKFKENTKIVHVNYEPNVAQIDEIINNDSIELSTLDIDNVRDNINQNSLDVYKPDECGICFLNAQFREQRTTDYSVCYCKSQGTTDKGTERLITEQITLNEEDLPAKSLNTTSDTIIHTIAKRSLKRNHIETTLSNVKSSKCMTSFEENHHCTTFAENPNVTGKWKGELQCVICNNIFENYTLIRQHFYIEHPDKKSHILCSEQDLNNRFKIMAHLLKTKYVKLHFPDIPSTATYQTKPTRNVFNSNPILKHDKVNIQNNENLSSLIDLLLPEFSKILTDDRDNAQNPVIVSTFDNSLEDTTIKIEQDNDGSDSNQSQINQKYSTAHNDNETQTEQQQLKIAKLNVVPYKSLIAHDEIQMSPLDIVDIKEEFIFTSDHEDANNDEFIATTSINFVTSPKNIENVSLNDCYNIENQSDDMVDFKCQLCNMIFTGNSLLTTYNQHLQTTHNKNESHFIENDQLIKLNAVPLNTKSKNKLKVKGTDKSDAYISKWMPVLSCALCSEKCDSFVLLKQHFRLKHSKQPYYVSCCDRKLKRRYKLIEHIRKHHDENFKNHKFTLNPNTRKDSLIKKKQKIKNKNQHTFKRNITNDSDVYISKFMPVLNCALCSEECDSFLMLKRHFRLKHSKQPYYISCCDRKLKRRYKIIEHIRKHHDENFKKDKLTLNPKTEKDSQIKKRQKIKIKNQHTFNRNIANDSDAYISKFMPALNCDLCSEKFESFLLLKQHFRCEHPEQPCYISCCYRKLKRRYKIIEHIRIQHDENFKKDKLTLNPKTGKDSQIKKTQKIKIKNQHTFKRNIANDSDAYISKFMPALNCDLCSEKFGSFLLLKQHFRCEHPEQPCYISCCHRKLKRRYKIIEHIHKRHDENSKNA